MKRIDVIVVAIAVVATLVIAQAPRVAPAAAQPTESVWTLSQTLVNPSNGPTEVTGPAVEGRKQGSEVSWTVGETSISHHKHEVDNGFDYYDVTWVAEFDRPPTVLTPGEKVELTASVSGSGTVTSKDGSGIAFEYRAEGVRENALDGVTYITIGMDPFEPRSVTGSFVVPSASPGGQIRVVAFLWNCSVCGVEWIYEAEQVPSEPAPTGVADAVRELIGAFGISAPVVPGDVSADVTRTRIRDGVTRTIAALGGQANEAAGPGPTTVTAGVGADFGNGDAEPASPSDRDVPSGELLDRIAEVTPGVNASTRLTEEDKIRIQEILSGIFWGCDAGNSRCDRRRASGQTVVDVSLSDGSAARLGVLVTAGGRITYTTNGEDYYTSPDEALDPSSRGWGVRASELISSIKRDWNPVRGSVPGMQLQNEIAGEVFDDFRNQLSAGDAPKSPDEWAEGKLWDKFVKDPLKERAGQLLWRRGRQALEQTGNSDALSLFDDLKAQFDDGKTSTPKAWTQIKAETGLDLFELSGTANAAVVSAEFAIKAVKEMGRSLQDTDFIVRSRTYFAEREAGNTPAQVWDISQNDPVLFELLDVGESKFVGGGVDSAMAQFDIPEEARRGILFTMYEEAYQRWRLASAIGRIGK